MEKDRRKYIKGKNNCVQNTIKRRSRMCESLKKCTR